VRALGARAIGPKAVHARWRLADGSALNITVNLAEEGLRESLEQLVRPAGADVLFDSGGALEALAEATSPATPSWSCASRQRRWSAHHERGHPQPSAHHRRDLTCADNLLHRLARRAGIAVQWTDAYDQPQVVDEDALRAILHAFGLACANVDDCRASLAQLEREDAIGYLPPLLTGVQHQAVPLPPQSRLHGQSCRVELENGARLAADFIRPEPAAPAAAHRGDRLSPPAGGGAYSHAGHRTGTLLYPGRRPAAWAATRLGPGRAALRLAQR
jgi:hypothetical protein